MNPRKASLSGLGIADLPKADGFGRFAKPHSNYPNIPSPQSRKNRMEILHINDNGILIPY
jgi:hypothetical protein